jgi:hypothetical protein
MKSVSWRRSEPTGTVATLGPDETAIRDGNICRELERRKQHADDVQVRRDRLASLHRERAEQAAKADSIRTETKHVRDAGVCYLEWINVAGTSYMVPTGWFDVLAEQVDGQVAEIDQAIAQHEQELQELQAATSPAA